MSGKSGDSGRFQAPQEHSDDVVSPVTCRACLDESLVTSTLCPLFGVLPYHPSPPRHIPLYHLLHHCRVPSCLPSHVQCVLFFMSVVSIITIGSCLDVPPFTSPSITYHVGSPKPCIPCPVVSHITSRDVSHRVPLHRSTMSYPSHFKNTSARS